MAPLAMIHGRSLPSLLRGIRGLNSPIVTDGTSIHRREYIEMNPDEALAFFDSRIAAIHGRGDKGGDVMDVRHEEFMAMTEAFLGPDYDSSKLAEVESQQLALQSAQAELAAALASNRIGPNQYLERVNSVHAEIAERCESILGPEDFQKLFGVPASQIGPYIDKETFMAQVSEMSQFT
jgi:hypothetical protein